MTVLFDLTLYISDHRSTSLMILAMIIAACAIGGLAVSGFVAFRLTDERRDRLRSHAARWRTIYIVASLLVMFVFGLGLHPEWVYAHAALMLGAGFTLGYQLLYTNARPVTRVWLIAAGVVAVVATLVRVYGLSAYPIININDEPAVLGWALSYLQRGYFTDPMMYYGGFDINRFMLPVAWWVSIFGSGFWQTRLFFFLLIFPLTGLTALAARNLYGNGWITALVMFSSAVVMGGARIRHDIGLALAVAASLWLYSKARKSEKLALHLLAGLAVGLGLFAHYHAILFGAALAIALYTPGYVERLKRGKRLPGNDALLFVLGGLTGAAVVVVFQILPSWEGFLAGRQLRNPQTLDQLLRAFFAYWQNIAFYSQLELLLVIAALVVALWRRRTIDIQLALLLVLLHLALALQASAPYPHYVLQVSPVYGILIAALFTDGFSGRKNAYAGFAAGVFMLANLGLTLQVPLQSLIQGKPLELPTPPVAAWIRTHIPTTDSIVTEHWYYLFLTDYHFISPLSPDYVPVSHRLESDTAIWDQIAPDVVVIDRNLSTCCVQQPIYDTAYLQSRGYQLIATLEGERFPVQVYEKGGG